MKIKLISLCFAVLLLCGLSTSCAGRDPAVGNETTGETESTAITTVAPAATTGVGNSDHQEPPQGTNEEATSGQEETTPKPSGSQAREPGADLASDIF